MESHTHERGGSPPHHSQYTLWMAPFLAAGVLLLLLFRGCQEPTYGGRPVSAWFEDSLALTPQQWDSSSEPDRAFEALEGDAVPFLIGPPASNAVEVLMRFATNANSENRVLAFNSLGAIGASARPATSMLSRVLADPDEAELHGGAARSLALIGFTPDEAVPALKELRTGTNKNAQYAALIALWNRDRQDAALQADIRSVLRSTNGNRMVFFLAHLGTNAAVFLPEIQRFAHEADGAGFWARKTIRNNHPTADQWK